MLVKCVFAFILFSFLASSVYIYNDLTDKNEDSKHPIKRLRPIASGLVSERIAKTLVLFLSGLSLICSLLLDLNLFIIFVIYFRKITVLQLHATSSSCYSHYLYVWVERYMLTSLQDARNFFFMHKANWFFINIIFVFCMSLLYPDSLPVKF